MRSFVYFFIIQIHQDGQIEHPSEPVLAHGPYVYHPWPTLDKNRIEQYSGFRLADEPNWREACSLLQNVYFEKPAPTPAAPGGKHLDGSLEVWRSSLQERAVEIKACPPPTGPWALHHRLHLHTVTMNWGGSSQITSKTPLYGGWWGRTLLLECEIVRVNITL